MPEQASFERSNGNVIIRLVENVIENSDDNGTIMYEYDEYLMVTTNRDGLEQEVQNNFAGWMDMAKVREEEMLKDEYRKKTQEYIRQEYSEHDEAKLTNAAVTAMINNEPTPQEYIAYRTYIEECKERARNLIYS
jgi:outer membrane PBP1 activator LpoA protein